MAENSQREKQKAHLRRKVVVGHRGKLQIPDIIEQNKEYAKYIMLAIAAVAILFVFGWAAYQMYQSVKVFSTYEVKWSQNTHGEDASDYCSYRDGFLQAGDGGIRYYKKNGTVVWQVPYEMKTPVTRVENTYVVVYDQGGRNGVICSPEGQSGQFVNDNQIVDCDVSQNGVVTVLSEDNKNRYINYFDRKGNKLDIEIMSGITTNGHPLAMASSPDGQALMVPYYYVANGKGNCRVDFYDFAGDLSQENKLAASFSYEETDTYLPFVTYWANDRAVAVGDNRILFYRIQNGAVREEKAIEIAQEIAKVFYNEQYIGLLIRQPEGYELVVYDKTGQCVMQKDETQLYETYVFDKKEVVMYNDKSCRIVSFSGRERFDLTFENGIYAMLPSGNQKEYYLASGQTLQLITLK